MSLLSPLFRQSFRSSGIYLLMIALCLAISATTALKFSNEQIQHAVDLQAAELLAADVQLHDTQPIEEKWQQQAQKLQLQQAQVTLFSSMAHTADKFVMVSVKAVDDAFPLRGKVVTVPIQRKIGRGEVWLSQRAMDILGVKVGDQVQIADGHFKVTALIKHDSNQEIGFSAFAPAVMIHQHDIAQTHAIQVGSRIEYRMLFAGQAHQIEQFKQQFRAFEQKQHLAKNPSTTQNNMGVEEQAGVKLRTAQESNSRLMKPIENLDIFLQLANILTILLCGIAIALTSQRYVQQNQDHIALMRCVGATRQQIFMSYFMLLAVVVAIAIVVGSIVGVALGYALLQLMIQLIPHLALQFSALDFILGPLPIAILTSVLVLLGFILPSLWQLLKTPPIRVIRQQEKSAQSWWLSLGVGALSLVLFSIILTGNFQLSALIMGAIFILSVLLYVGIWSILNILLALKNRLSAYIRTPKQMALQITALALGLSLITVLMVLRTDLLERWQQQLPERTPNQFVYGLPPFEVEQFKQQLQAQGWEHTPFYPSVRGRLIAKNGQAFSTDVVQKNNALRRELNLTQSNQYPQDNKILMGDATLSQVGQVSVEAKVAEDLGIAVGDELTFSLPEGNLKAKVINLRSVEWESFSPNFFFIFSPKSMDENAGSYLSSFYVPPEQKDALLPIIQQFSNTVFIDISLILQEIKQIVDVLVKIITVLAILVTISGFLVLIACLNLLMDERKQEVALLRSFGSSKQRLKTMMSVEIGFMGALAGVAACLFAESISAIVSYKMNLALQLHAPIWFILPISMAVLCFFIGRYRLSYLCDLPPLQSLREMG